MLDVLDLRGLILIPVLYGLIATVVISYRRSKIRQEILSNPDATLEEALQDRDFLTFADGASQVQIRPYIMHLILLIGLLFSAMVTPLLIVWGLLLALLVPITAFFGAFWVYPKNVIEIEEFALAKNVASARLKRQRFLAWFTWILYLTIGSVIVFSETVHAGFVLAGLVILFAYLTHNLKATKILPRWLYAVVVASAAGVGLAVLLALLSGSLGIGGALAVVAGIKFTVLSILLIAALTAVFGFGLHLSRITKIVVYVGLGSVAVGLILSALSPLPFFSSLL